MRNETISKKTEILSMKNKEAQHEKLDALKLAQKETLSSKN